MRKRNEWPVRVPASVRNIAYTGRATGDARAESERRIYEPILRMSISWLPAQSCLVRGMKPFLYLGKICGFLLLGFSGVGTVWYARDGLNGSNIGHIFLIASVVIFAVVAYLMHDKKIMTKTHLVVVIAVILVLGILCISLSPILLYYTDNIHWLWLVEALYDPGGVLFLAFARDVVLLDQTGITAHVGFDAYNLGNATVMKDFVGNTIILELPDSLHDSLSSGCVISIDHGAIGAANPHTIPNIMPPTIVIATPFEQMYPNDCGVHDC